MALEIYRLEQINWENSSSNYKTVNTAVSITGVTSYTTITGFQANITPASTSNKILVMVQMMHFTSSNDEYLFCYFTRSNTDASITAIGNGSAGNYNSFGGVFGNTTW